MSSNYNFLTKFELLSALHCKSNSIHIICEAIEKATSTEIVRNIIQRGIESYLDKTKDFRFIATVHNEFQKQSLIKNHNANAVAKRNSQSSHICNSVFGIENLSCKIFGYLDFQSSLRCMHVSKQWLYDSLNPSSSYHLNTHDISKHLNFRRLVILPDFNCDISRFKNIASLQTQYWVASNNEIFATLKTFLNIKNLSIAVINHTSKSNYIQILSKIVDNNCHGVEKVSLYRHGAKYTTLGLLASVVAASFRLLFNVNIINLTQLHFNGLKLNFFCVNGDINKIEILTIENCILDLKFWSDLSDPQCILSNIKKLVLKNNKIQRLDNLKTIRTKYVELIAQKLINIESFICLQSAFFRPQVSEASNSSKPFQLNRQIVFGGNMKLSQEREEHISCGYITSCLLSQLVGNKLKTLDIDIIPQFAHIRNNNQQQKQQSFDQIKKCNFENLENVRIGFIPGKTTLVQGYSQVFKNVFELLSLAARKADKSLENKNEKYQLTQIKIGDSKTMITGSDGVASSSAVGLIFCSSLQKVTIDGLDMLPIPPNTNYDSSHCFNVKPNRTDYKFCVFVNNKKFVENEIKQLNLKFNL